MELVVVDACVAAKWLFSERDTAAANELLFAELRFGAPSIIRVEVAGAALRKFRLGAVDEASARNACERWESVLSERFVQLVSNDELHEAAVALAFRIQHTLVDCLYLAAAQILDCRLITADRPFFERAGTLYPRIELLRQAA